MDVTQGKGRKPGWLRWLGWGGAMALIALPFILMKAAPQTGFDWTAGDFALASVLIGTVGVMVEAALRAPSNWPYRLGALVAAGTGLLLIWSNLAVGYIGNGDAPINSVFLAIPVLALVGAIIVQGNARALSWIMGGAGLVHAIAGIIGYPQDPRTGAISILFLGLWLASATLFRRAAASHS